MPFRESLVGTVSRGQTLGERKKKGAADEREKVMLLVW